MKNTTTITYTDGGRKESGRKGKTHDCVVRAIAIATEQPYDKVYKDLANLNKEMTGLRSARNGLFRKVYEKYLNSIGWYWQSAPKFNGRKAYHYDMPDGKVIGRQAGHLVAIIDRVIHDSWDSRHKMVYGYWKSTS